MFVSSLGEGVERVVGSLAYFMGQADPYFGSYRELQRNALPCLSPDEVPLFSAQQYGQPGFLYEPFTEDTFLGWIQGRRLLSNEPVWVPGQLVEMVYLMHPHEGVIGYSASGGLSCHVDRTNALYHAITELIERDAVNLRWYLGVPPEEILFDRSSDDPRLQALLDDLPGMAGSQRFFQHSVDFRDVPVVTVIQLDPWMRSFSYNAGGGVDLDIDQAIYGALVEFGQSERTVRMSTMTPERAVSISVDRMFGVDPDISLEQMTLYVQAIGYYGHRANQAKMSWYLTDNPTVPLSDLAKVERGAAWPAPKKRSPTPSGSSRATACSGSRPTGRSNQT